MAGRPTKLTKEMIEQIRRLIILGLSYQLVCDNLGISIETFRQWRLKGKELVENKDKLLSRYNDNDNLLVELFNTVTKANAEMVARRLARLDKGAEMGKHQIDMWFLERRLPEEFGVKQVLKVGNETDEPLKVKLSWPDQN